MVENNNEGKKENNDIFDIRIFISAAIVIFLIVLGSYIGNFADKPITKEIADWGTFGDYMGGTLNPIFAFLSFIALLYTIQIQSKELKKSSEALELSKEELSKSSRALEEQSASLKIQNFENTFFNMLNLHNEIVKNIEIKEEQIFKYYSSPKINFSIVNFYMTNDKNNISGRRAIKKIVEGIDSISKKNPSRLFLKRMIYVTMQHKHI